MNIGGIEIETRTPEETLMCPDAQQAPGGGQDGHGQSLARELGLLKRGVPNIAQHTQDSYQPHVNTTNTPNTNSTQRVQVPHEDGFCE